MQLVAGIEPAAGPRRVVLMLCRRGLDTGLRHSRGCRGSARRREQRQPAAPQQHRQGLMGQPLRREDGVEGVHGVQCVHGVGARLGGDGAMVTSAPPRPPSPRGRRAVGPRARGPPGAGGGGAARAFPRASKCVAPAPCSRAMDTLTHALSGALVARLIVARGPVPLAASPPRPRTAALAPPGTVARPRRCPGRPWWWAWWPAPFPTSTSWRKASATWPIC